MDTQIVCNKIDEHERASQARYESLSSKLDSPSIAHETKGTTKMTEKIENIIGTPSGHMYGDGLGLGGLGGGGIIGGLILGSLLGNRNGLFGNNGVGGDAAVGLQNTSNTNAVLGAISDVKAAVPLTACQTQSTVEAAAKDITGQTLQQTIALNNAINQSQLAAAQGFASTGDKIDQLASATAVAFGLVNTNIERTGWQIAQTVINDGEKTRALITANQIAELNRIAQERQDEIIELRNNAARQNDRHGIEITMNNNQNQNQLQFQAQAQVLNQLTHALLEVGQIARATNQSLIIGNSGPVASGPQTANPVNVRT